MEWTLHNTTAKYLKVGHTSDVHARIWIWAWAWDHGISKNPRVLASQMSEGVKGESGDWQRQGGKKNGEQPASLVSGRRWDNMKEEAPFQLLFAP